MKTILCYGDSNTWGYNAADRTRFPRDVRWPGVLRQELGAGYEVIEEGLGGRTTVFDDPIYEYRNGKEYLIPCLSSHAPLDLVVIMLGTNDLQVRFGRSAAEIAAGAGVLVGITLRSGSGPGGGAPRALLLAPPPLGNLPDDEAEFLEGGEAKSWRFAQQYRREAASWGCAFLNAGDHIVSCDQDGVHFEASQHQKLGRAVADAVRGMLA